MPRDGFEIYNIPSGTHGSPDTTIESAKYNAFVDDVALDLNAPRPILSGGTGADDKREAMTNLDGEIAKQVIANFDSDLLYPGSFYCLTTATGSPVAGHAFQGWIYVTDNNNMAIQARDASDTMIPGRLYSREKRAGVWSTWKKDGTTIIGDAEGIASETGDMFFGIKGVAPASKFIVNDKKDATGLDLLTVNKGGASSFKLAANVNANLTNAAGTLTLTAANDAAAAIPFTLTATTVTINGQVNFPTIPTAPSAPAGDATLKLATTAFVSTYYMPRSGGAFTGAISSNSSISAAGNLYGAALVLTNHIYSSVGGGAVFYMNAANNRYLQYYGAGDYFILGGAHLYTAAGRVWGTGDFGGVPVSNGRLVYITDVTGGTAIVEPYGGAVITGFGMAGVYSPILRFRWMQLYTSGWFTVGYA